MRAERTRVRCLQHQVFRVKSANPGCVTSGVPPPQQKGHRSVHEGAQNGFGQGLPSKGRMAARGAGCHRQYVVEQQHALFCPAFEVSGARRRPPHICGDLSVDVTQRRWQGPAIRDGKRKPLRLAHPVVGVLTQDDHAHVLRSTHCFQCPEPKGGPRKAGPGPDGVVKLLLKAYGDGLLQILPSRHP